MTDIAFCSATELASSIRAGKIGCRELLDHYVGRIEKYDGAINAVVLRAFEAARIRADKADAALARGEIWGPLHGVPMTVKESFNVAGLPTSWGVPAWKDNIAENDAVMVARLKDAGAVIMGKTNLPMMLLDIQSNNQIHGRTNNPYDLDRTPGGSSGGAAAAVAAGLTGLELGSDIGGSIRVPSHFCGVYGHKSSWGILPTRGHSPGEFFAPVDVLALGPLARRAEDLALVIGNLAGADGPDAEGWMLSLPPPRHERLSDFRVAVWIEDERCPIDAAVAGPLQDLVAQLVAAGAKVEMKARPDFDPRISVETYYPLMLGVTTASLPEAEFQRALTTAATLSPEDRSMGARVVRGTVMRHRDWVVTNETRARLRRAWQAFFRDYDVVLMPTWPVAAFPHDSTAMSKRVVMVNGKPTPYWDGVYWAQFTGVGGLPATIAPVGRTKDGLPVGVQIVGPGYGDLTTIAFARLISERIGGYEPPKGYD